MTCTVVTGASAGIGEGLARDLPEAGDAVVIVARREERLASLAEELRARDVDARPVAIDVRDPDAASAIAAAAAAAGGASVLINNAGGAFKAPLEEISLKGWQTIMALNVDAPFSISNALFPQLRESGKGSIINIGSVAGDLVNPGFTPYASSKAALHHLTRHQAREWGRHGIRANVIAPGPVATEGGRWGRPEAAEASRRLIAIGRALRVDEVVDAARFLLTSTGVTGAVLTVDGGFVGFGEEMDLDM